MSKSNAGSKRNVLISIGGCLNMKMVAAPKAGVKAAHLINGLPAYITGGRRLGVMPGDLWHCTVDEVKDDRVVYLTPVTLLSPADGMNAYLSGYDYRQVVRVRKSGLFYKKHRDDVANQPALLLDQDYCDRVAFNLASVIQDRKIAPAYRLKLARNFLSFVDKLELHMHLRYALEIQEALSAVAYTAVKDKERIAALRKLALHASVHQSGDLLKDRDRHARYLAELGRHLSKTGDHRAALDSYLEALSFKEDNAYLQFEVGKLYMQLGDMDHAYAFMSCVAAQHVKEHRDEDRCHFQREPEVR